MLVNSCFLSGIASFYKCLLISLRNSVQVPFIELVSFLEVKMLFCILSCNLINFYVTGVHLDNFCDELVLFIWCFENLFKFVHGFYVIKGRMLDLQVHSHCSFWVSHCCFRFRKSSEYLLFNFFLYRCEECLELWLFELGKHFKVGLAFLELLQIGCKDDDLCDFFDKISQDLFYG